MRHQRTVTVGICAILAGVWPALGQAPASSSAAPMTAEKATTASAPATATAKKAKVSAKRLKTVPSKVNPKRPGGEGAESVTQESKDTSKVFATVDASNKKEDGIRPSDKVVKGKVLTTKDKSKTTKVKAVDQKVVEPKAVEKVQEAKPQ